jgi:hypothetical protein
MPGIKNTQYNCGYQQIAAATLAASTALTIPTVPGNGALSARYAVIQCEGGEVRWRDDGTAPTSTVGFLLAQYPDQLVYDGDLTALRFIRTSASSILNVSYYF